jgi:hypothetical protein
VCALDTCCTCCTRVCVRHTLHVLSRVCVRHLLSLVSCVAPHAPRALIVSNLHPCFSHRQLVQLCKLCVSLSRYLSAKNCMCNTPPAPTPAVSPNPRVLSTVFFSSLPLFAAPGRPQNPLTISSDTVSNIHPSPALTASNLWLVEGAPRGYKYRERSRARSRERARESARV